MAMRNCISISVLGSSCFEEQIPLRRNVTKYEFLSQASKYEYVDNLNEFSHFLQARTVFSSQSRNKLEARRKWGV